MRADTRASVGCGERARHLEAIVLAALVKKTVQIGQRHAAATALAQRFVMTIHAKAIDGDDSVAVEHVRRHRYPRRRSKRRVLHALHPD